MKKFRIQTVFAVALIPGFLLGLFSCLDDNWDFDKLSDEIELTPGVALPIAYGQFSIQDLLDEFDPDSYVKQTDENLLYLVYASELLSFPASDVISINDQFLNQLYVDSDILIPAWLGSNPGDTLSFLKNQNGVFSLDNNARLDSIYVKTLDLRIDVESRFEHEGLLIIRSDSLLIDGEPFYTEVQISDASGDFMYSGNRNLNGVTMILDNSVPDTSFLPMTYELFLINSGNPVNPDDFLDIQLNFVNISYNTIFGYVGDWDLLISRDTIEVEVYNEGLDEGEFFFASPEVTFTVKNSYGVPVDLYFNEVTTYSDIREIETNLNLMDFDPFSIQAPDLDNIGSDVISTGSINKDNSNLVAAIETFPNEFRYDISAVTNPGGGMNFVTDTSRMEVDFEVLLPIWLRANGIAAEDTTEFNYYDEIGEDADIVDYLRMTMDATNGIPLEVGLQAYFLDDNYVVLDSLFADEILLLPPALTEEDSIVSNEVYSRSVEFTKAKIEGIKPATWILTRAYINTSDAKEDGYAKFYSNYFIDFKIKATADLRINSRD